MINFLFVFCPRSVRTTEFLQTCNRYESYDNNYITLLRDNIPVPPYVKFRLVFFVRGGNEAYILLTDKSIYDSNSRTFNFRKTHIFIILLLFLPFNFIKLQLHASDLKGLNEGLLTVRHSVLGENEVDPFCDCGEDEPAQPELEPAQPEQEPVDGQGEGQGQGSVRKFFVEVRKGNGKKKYFFRQHIIFFLLKYTMIIIDYNGL